jgi:hypothetical protein
MRIDRGVAPDPVVRKTKYPWMTLDIGESFEPGISLGDAKSAAIKASRRYRRTFQAGLSAGKVRIWRW